MMTSSDPRMVIFAQRGAAVVHIQDPRSRAPREALCGFHQQGPEPRSRSAAAVLCAECEALAHAQAS